MLAKNIDKSKMGNNSNEKYFFGDNIKRISI